PTTACCAEVSFGQVETICSARVLKSFTRTARQRRRSIGQTRRPQRLPAAAEPSTFRSSRIRRQRSRGRARHGLRCGHVSTCPGSGRLHRQDDRPWTVHEPPCTVSVGCVLLRASVPAPVLLWVRS